MALATAYKERLVLLGRQGRKRVAGIVQPVTSRVCSIVCQRALSRQTNSFVNNLSVCRSAISMAKSMKLLPLFLVPQKN